MDNKIFYTKGDYILFGNPEERNGFIVCKTYKTRVKIHLLDKLNETTDKHKNNNKQQ